MKTIVINLYGGPGAGKSTLAADLYVQMKKEGHSVEMVREVAKEWAWEGRKIGMFDQIAIIGEQLKKESNLYNKVRYLITDSPIALGAFYLEHNHRVYFMKKMVKKFYELSELHGVEYRHYLIDRNKPYIREGRYETEQKAKQIDELVESYLINMELDFEKKTPDLTDIRGIKL